MKPGETSEARRPAKHAPRCVAASTPDRCACSLCSTSAPRSSSSSGATLAQKASTLIDGAGDLRAAGAAAGACKLQCAASHRASVASATAPPLCAISSCSSPAPTATRRASASPELACGTPAAPASSCTSARCAALSCGGKTTTCSRRGREPPACVCGYDTSRARYDGGSLPAATGSAHAEGTRLRGSALLLRSRSRFSLGARLLRGELSRGEAAALHVMPWTSTRGGERG